MKKLLTLSLLVLIAMDSFSQRTGQNYRLLGQQMLKNDRFELSKVYFDSAFQTYTGDQHFASAALTFLNMEELVEDSLLADTMHYYMRVVYDSAKNYKKYDLNTFVLRSNLKLAMYYFDKELYDSAEVILNQTIGSSIKKFGVKAPENNRVYAAASTLSFQAGKMDSAAMWSMRDIQFAGHEDGLAEKWIQCLEYSILSEDERCLDALNTSRNNFDGKVLLRDLYKAESIYRSGEINRATQVFEQIDFDGDSTLHVGLLLKYRLLQSVLLFENGEFDKSLNIARTYLSVGQQTYKQSHPILTGYYIQVGKLYYEKSDFGASKEFLENLLTELDDKLVNRHPLKANVFYEYSKTLSALEQYIPAIAQIDSAIVTASHLPWENSLFLGLAYGQKGITYYHIGQSDSSEFYLKKSHNLLDQSLDNKNHIYLAKVLNDLGLLYQSLNKDQKAIDHYFKSLTIYRKILGKVHPHLGKGYNNVSHLYLKNEEYRLALRTFQVAMTSNVFDFFEEDFKKNPTLENVLSDFILLKSLSGKVEALDRQYQVSQDTSLLYTSLRTYDLITAQIDKLRTGYVSIESKHFLSEKTSYLYEKAIQVCLELGRKSNDDFYKRYAFKFSEKSRTGLLLAGIQDAKAKKIAGVPDSLLLVEESLVKEVSLKENDLFDELNKGKRSRNRVVSQLKDDLFHLRNQYSDHIVFLEDQYHNYFQLKYDSYTATIADVQENLLPKRNKKDKKKNTLLEYFVGQDSIYRFQISQHQYDLVVTRKPNSFEDLIKGLRNSIKYQVSESFINISNELSSILVPSDIDKKQHFIIIPDGILSYLPFESLILDVRDKPLKKQNFLIKNATISYSYSATLSVEMAANKPGKDFNNSFTGFAPIFSDQNKYVVLSSNKETEMDGQIAKGEDAKDTSAFSKLPMSEIELRDIHNKLKNRKFETEAYFYAAASKDNLVRERTLNSRFLHFATHGLLDADNPERSGIVLADSLETEILTIGEIYGLDLKSEIVTLSACETGMGKLIGGEGLVSFSRGFFYTGTRFIIVSLWQVDDLSTSMMMKKFYGKYAKKKNGDLYGSFQKSRLKVMKNRKYSKLSDWFPFILVGMH